MDPIYLDYAATTPVRAEVSEAMVPLLATTFGNPSSAHRWGRVAREALEQAREELATALGAHASEVTFVRGGTESDNLAILGWCAAERDVGERPTLVVSAVEHPAVLEAAEHAERAGLARVVQLAVEPTGDVDLDGLREAVSAGPALVSMMWVNNECGMELPIEQAAAIAAEAGATLHSDAAQAVGKVPVDLGSLPVDVLSGTGHKIYAPKGTGFLVTRERTRLAPLLHGGGQERGLRPGTEDVAGAVALATAVRLAVAEREAEASRLAALRDSLEQQLRDRIEGVRVNAGAASRAPHVSSVGFAGIEAGASLVMGLDLEGIAVSGGSACASGSTKASHVMRALYGSDDTFATVRFSLGRDTKPDDIRRAVDAAVTVVGRMRDA